MIYLYEDQGDKVKGNNNWCYEYQVIEGNCLYLGVLINVCGIQGVDLEGCVIDWSDGKGYIFVVEIGIGCCIVVIGSKFSDEVVGQVEMFGQWCVGRDFVYDWVKGEYFFFVVGQGDYVVIVLVGQGVDCGNVCCQCVDCVIGQGDGLGQCEIGLVGIGNVGDDGVIGIQCDLCQFMYGLVLYGCICSECLVIW